MTDNCFTPFISPAADSLIPDQFNDPFEQGTPAICKIAAKELQDYLLKHQASWQHNFGFEEVKKSHVRGKMFGVLVVKNSDEELGYLSAFSGKMEDEAPPEIFVPSLFDLSTNDHFVPKGMIALSELGAQIRNLEAQKLAGYQTKISQLKIDRKQKSIQLQQQLFEQYAFLNRAGQTKSLYDIFADYASKKPPSGAGECAAPKLLQYAYEHNMRPLAITEFWWGKPPKSKVKKHMTYYPACEEKCRPILSFMLNGK